MCEKKPGPRCSNHLIPQLDTVKQKVVKLTEQLPEAEHARALAESRLSDQSLKRAAQQELYDAGNTNPTTTELFAQKAQIQERERVVARAAREKEAALREELARTEVQHKDLKTRFLGTRTGQKITKQKAVELRMNGRATEAVALEKEANRARKLHERSIEYAKWAEKVENGNIPGRFVESKGTSASRFVAHSGDPVYDATREDLAKLSNEDLEHAESGRYGAFAMTPATKQKISDEKHRRRKIATGEDTDFAEAEKYSRERYPEAWKTVKDTTYGDNYLTTVWSNTPYREESSVLVMANTIEGEKATVWDSEEGRTGQISYQEALSKAVSKEDVSSPTATGRNATPMLTLDDGSKVIVTREIFGALRFNKAIG